MKHFFGSLLVFAGFAYLFFPQAELEKGPKPLASPHLHLPLRREATLGISTNIFQFPTAFKKAIQGVKVLLNPQEHEAMRDRLIDHENIDEAAQALVRVQGRFSQAEERGRLDAVDFLVNSLTHPENPDRNYVLGAISEVILSENLFQTQDLRYRKSLAGDKVELYQVLTSTDPSVARELFKYSQNGNLSKVLRFAKGRAEFASLANLRGP